jgi:hypothetical protein
VTAVGNGQVIALTTNAQLVLHEREARDQGWWDRMRTAISPAPNSASRDSTETRSASSPVPSR